MKAKYIPTPEKLYELWNEYKQWCVENPYRKNDFRGSEAKEVFLEFPRPATIAGFEKWLSEKNIIHDLGQYLCNYKNAYDEYQEVVRQIRTESKGIVLDGALANIWNGNLAARYLGLSNVTEQKVVHEFEMPDKSRKQLSQRQIKALIDISNKIFNDGEKVINRRRSSN